MGKRIVGALFCITSIFLYILPSILAAIIANGNGIGIYSIYQEEISFKPLIVLTAIVGIAYLLYAEIGSVYKLKQRDEEGKKS